MVGRGVEESYCTHLTEGHNPHFLETERESTGRKQGETEDTMTKRKAGQALDTEEKHAYSTSHKRPLLLLLMLDWQGQQFSCVSNPAHTLREVVTQYYKWQPYYAQGGSEEG